MLFALSGLRPSGLQFRAMLVGNRSVLRPTLFPRLARRALRGFRTSVQAEKEQGVCPNFAPKERQWVREISLNGKTQVVQYLRLGLYTSA